MKHRKSFVWSASILAGSFLALLSGPFLSSCSQEIEQPEQPGGVPVSVSADLKVSICPITPVVPPATRGKGNADSSDDSKTLRVKYVQPDATRSDMSAAEKEIKSAYVVQFNGTSSTSTAVSVSGNVAAQLNNGNPVSYDFMLTSGVKNRVYVIANPKTTPTAGMTLQALEVVAYTVTTALPATGLPMAAYQDVALGETFNLFQLKSPLAKLKFTTPQGTLTLKGIPSAYSLASTGIAPGGSAVRPSGVTYTNTLALTSGTTYYIPANLSGQVAGLVPTQRYSGRAPVSSMFVDIFVSNTYAIYSIYLGNNSTTDFNVTSNYLYTVSVTSLGTNASDLRVKLPTDLNTGGKSANSYIVTAAGNTYGFNATKAGNDSNVSGITKPTDLGTATEARVIWQTGGTTSVIKSVKLSSGKVLFETGTATEGNAMIGIFASNAAGAPCLWSWHIWRLPSSPGTVACTKTPSPSSASASFAMMDRNLGAFNNTIANVGSIGLLYQWGRKDPFPGPAGFNATEPSNIFGSVSVGGAVSTLSGAYTLPKVKGDASTGTINYTIQYPGVFIYANTNNDWLSAKNNNLWGTSWVDAGSVDSYNGSQGTKSIYDPCPIGYRVPPHDFANKVVVGGAWNAGRSFTGIVSSGSFWFPASGFRGGDSDAGKLAYGGTTGNYWSSSPYSATSNQAGFFYFFGSSATPRGNESRARGKSVRCVSE